MIPRSYITSLTKIMLQQLTPTGNCDWAAKGINTVIDKVSFAGFEL